MSALSIASPEHCRYCGHPVGAGWALGARKGFLYADKTVICDPCHQTSVKDDAVLLTAWRFVVKACTELGLHATWGEVKVRLRNTPNLEAMTTGHGVVGLARSQQWGSQITSDITILYGMPMTHAVETLAHEAGHVWCHENGIEFTPYEVVEGFCNVVAYLVVQQLPGNLCPEQNLKALFENSDPVYGVGFRQEWQKMNNYSWPQYLTQVKKLKDW